MGEFFHDLFEFLKFGAGCCVVLYIATVAALSLPQSQARDFALKGCKLGFAALCAFYCVSPVDFLPELALGPFGFVDDLGVAYLGYSNVKDALKPLPQH